MKKTMICLACMLVFFVVGVAGAVSQNITLGPCNVTFDLGFDEPVDFIPVDVLYTETLHGDKYVEYETYSPYVMTVSAKVFITPESCWKTLQTSKIERLYSTDQNVISSWVVDRVIDGNPGHLVKVKYDHMDGIMYTALYNTINNTVAMTVHSAYPWDEGTTNLLNSIQIEKVA